MLKKAEVLDVLACGGEIMIDEIYYRAIVYAADGKRIDTCRYDTAQKIRRAEGYTATHGDGWTFNWFVRKAEQQPAEHEKKPCAETDSARQPQERKHKKCGSLILTRAAQNVKENIMERYTMNENAAVKGFITNLGKYNEGELVGRWISFPIDEDELQSVCAEIGCYYTDEDGNEHNREYEEFFFTDWETDVDGLDFGEYVSIEKVNEVAEAVDGWDKYEKAAFGAFMDHGEDAATAAERVSNGDYFCFPNCDSMADVAEQYADETGLLDEISDHLHGYFDFEAYGRDMEIEGNFYYRPEIDGYVQIF